MDTDKKGKEDNKAEGIRQKAEGRRDKDEKNF